MASPARRTLDPKLDVVFKILFAHPDSTEALRSLLSAVLKPSSPIEEVEVLNPEVDKEDVLEKGVVLDLRVRMADRSLVDGEMQAQRRSGSRKRILREHPCKFEPPGRAVILRQIVSRANPSVSAEIREVNERREMA